MPISSCASSARTACRASSSTSAPPARKHAIDFDEEAYSLGLVGSYEYDGDVLRFSYSSMTTPSEVFDYDMRTRERTLLKVQEIPSGHEPSDYVTRRLMARAPDGEEVPVSILYRKDTPLDGSAPCLLYGYGSYGMAIPASFNTNWPVAGRSRLHLRDRPYPRRQGQGLCLVRGRQARQESEYLHRLHRRRRPSRRRGLHQPWPHRPRRADRRAAC